MNIGKINLYSQSHEKAFECLCNQLFKSYLLRTLKETLVKFRVINGAGGDGGIEAYGEAKDGSVHAIQAKWFLQPLNNGEFKQIRNSIDTAISVRKNIVSYTICIPHNASSKKNFKGTKDGRSITDEETRIDQFADQIKKAYPNLTIVWWFEEEILEQIQLPQNENFLKYWFENEVISIDFLKNRFELQKEGWLKEKYIPHLTKEGAIFQEYESLINSESFRKERIKLIDDVIQDLNEGRSLIIEFILTFELSYLKKRLLVIERNFKEFIEVFQKVKSEIKIGIEVLISINPKEVPLWRTKLILEELTPTNLQLNILPILIKSLDRIHKYDIENYLKSFESINSNFLFVSGRPGTGKTSGLSKITDIHLKNESPAIIINAKEAKVDSWGSIFSKELNLKDWSLNEIMAGLESTAVRSDHQRLTHDDGEQKFEDSKVIICIDGLDEDITNWDKWIHRINEARVLCNNFLRLKFIFSGRGVFFTYGRQRIAFENDIVRLRHNDVHIEDVAPIYFQEYKIVLESLEQVKGLDSLFALKLFCEKYQNHSISNNENLITASEYLLNDKLEHLNREFLNHPLIKGEILLSKRPVIESLESICNGLYELNKVSEGELSSIISNSAKYLKQQEIDILRDILCEHGILYFEKEIKAETLFPQFETSYSICYQSIIDLVLTKLVVRKILKGDLIAIPEKFNKSIPISPLEAFDMALEIQFRSDLNTDIVKNICLRVFNSTGKLVGENEFLGSGFDTNQIFELQMHVLINGPYEKVNKYGDEIVARMGIDTFTFNKYLENLILPSVHVEGSFFGAEFLNSFLRSFKNSFERDKIWSGLDDFEFYSLSEEKRYEYKRSNVIKTLKGGDDIDFISANSLIIYDCDKYNEGPLIAAWALTTIDMGLKRSMSVSLTIWGKHNVSEFILLLDRVFNCDDPSVQEGLANIVYNLSGLIDDESDINLLARWGLDNVFRENGGRNYNLIVRSGFQTACIRAYYLDLISEKELDTTRPNETSSEIPLLDFDKSYIENEEPELYPIVHDLAGYVLPSSYRHFLEYPKKLNGKLHYEGSQESKELIGLYQEAIGNYEIFTGTIITAIARAYIKALGFNRTKGNNSTKATHGSKSKILTKEEKYLWLAVNYIRGYLAEYLPVKKDSNDYEKIKSYNQIVELDYWVSHATTLDEKLYNFNNRYLPKWIVYETLTPELPSGIGQIDGIESLVNEKPKINFEHWLTVSEVLVDKGKTTNVYALYNYTDLNNSSETINTSISARACFISMDLKNEIIDFFNRSANEFLDHFEIDSLKSHPSGVKGSNVFDLTWMNWIEDKEDGLYLPISSKKDEKLLYSITKSKDINSGEDIMMPSKYLRDKLEIVKVNSDVVFYNKGGDIVARSHRVMASKSKMGRQEILMILSERLEQFLTSQNLEIIWFVTHISSTNPHNQSLKGSSAQKVRKYLVYRNGQSFDHSMFWEARFSNSRHPY